jgi:hypothetical protein
LEIPYPRGKKRKGRLERFREEHSSHEIKDDEVRNAVRKGQRVLNYSEQQIQ